MRKTMQSISSWKLGSRGPRPAAVSVRRPTISHVDRRAGLLRIGRPKLRAGVCCAEYKQWARTQLTEELRSRYLPITGSKDVLVSRLEEDDELCAQVPPQGRGRKSQNIALSIRNEGIVPPFNKVTKAQIVAELRRRGAEVSAKSKIELYEALEAAVRSTQGDSYVASPPDSTSEAKNFAEAMNLISNPAYEPASASVDELRSLLQLLKVPSEGTKAELLEQVNSYRSELQDMPKEPQGSSPGDPMGAGSDFDLGFSQGSSPREQQSWGEGIVETAAAEVASMPPKEIAAALEARGEKLRSPYDFEAMQQRLTACLVRERQALASPGGATFPPDTQAESSLLSSTFGPEDPGLGGGIWDDDGLQNQEGSGEEQESLGVWARPDMPPMALHSNTHMLLTEATPRIRVAVITGGPSGEASLSLESARTVVDALQTRLHPSQAAGLEATLEREGYPEVYKEFGKHGISCDTYYVDSSLQAWLVPASMVYSRTPADFEFKLPETSIFLGDASALAAHLKASVDIAFPVVHGAFGEDGQLGAALREAGVPFVGSPPEASGVAFNKVTSRLALLEAGFPALEQIAFVEEDFVTLSCESEDCKLSEDGQEKMDAWIEESGMDRENGAVVLKPAEEGSSINVRFAFGLQDAIEHAHDLLANEGARLVVMEPKVIGAIEFSVCVLQAPSNVVIALPPTSMEIVDLNSDIEDHLKDVHFGLVEQQQGQGIERVHLFDDLDPHATFVSYNRKYQPNNELRTHTPAKMPLNAVQAIRRTAERAFLDLGLRDYARFDGWIMLHSEQQHMKMLTDLMLDDGTPKLTHQNTELPLPGFGPLPEEEFLQEGVFDITEEQLRELEPEFESEPMDDYIYSPAHDRYFTPEQLEYAKELEADELEAAEIQQRVYEQQYDTRDIGLPQHAIPAARGDDSASFQPVTTPIDAVQKPINELVQFEGGMVILGDVNPCTGLEQGSLMFMQGAAVGWSHAGVLRHIVAGALQRARLQPLPPPTEPIARNPEVLSQGEDLPGSVLARFTNTTQEMQDVHGDEWPATFADEDGGCGGASAWRQPGSILAPEHENSEDSEVSSTVNGAVARPLAALSHMVNRGSENHFEEIEDDAFEGLIEHWDVDDSDEESEGADSEETDAIDADAADDERAVQQDPEESWASLRERATLLGVCANDLHHQDMERVAREIAAELPPDELESEDLVNTEQVSGLTAATRENPMGAASRLDMMEDLREDDLGGSEPEEEPPRIGEVGTPAERQKVYVLCGGDSSERQVSLQSGVTAWLQLRRYHDIEATLYILVPQWSSLRERRRRQDMLHQRTHFLLNGLEEENLPQGLTLDEIRRPRMDNLPPIEQRLVWAVPHALALRHSVEEVVEACELLAMTATTVGHDLPVGAVEGNMLRDQIQWELDALGLKGAGMMFEGLGAPHATSFDFVTFAHHAQMNSAVVFNTIHGALGEDGTLQQYLSYYDIPYTGSPEAPSRICMNKLETAECIGNMDTEGFFPIPKIELFLSDLAELCRSPHMAEAGLEGMRYDLVVHESMPLVIKPAADGCSTGVFRIQEPEHLLTYAFAVAQEWDEIPIEMTAGGTDPITMPADISNSFIVEPYIATDTVKFHREPISAVKNDPKYEAAVKIANDILPHVEDGSIKDKDSTQAPASQYLINAVEHGELPRPVPGATLEDLEAEDAETGDEAPVNNEDPEKQEIPFPLVHNVVSNAIVSRMTKQESTEGLVEVTIGVYGPMGEMTAMTPSMTLKEGGVLSLGEKFATGHGVSLTPPPDHIAPKESVEAARVHAETIANNLGLVGFARIDAFMGVEDGTLFVIEINTVPGLAPNNVLFQQALLEDPPIYPGEFCRLQVLIARSQGGAIDTSATEATAQELSGYFDEDEIADAIAEANQAGEAAENADDQDSQDELSPADQLEFAEVVKSTF